MRRRAGPTVACVGSPLRSERGQATVEWTGLVLLASLALGALARFGPSVDGRSFGGFLAHRIVCAVRGGCDDGDAALARVYGPRRAALLREHAPGVVYEPGERQLPVDWRRCRVVECAEAPDDRDLDAHRTEDGERATVFTRVVRRQGRLYLQYWFFYPDSNTTWAGSDRLWNASPLRWAGKYPGFHHDDWEGYVVRLDPDGSVWARASSHGHWQGCKWRSCRRRWVRNSGWTRVSRGSHAGHVPGRLIHAGHVPGRLIAPRPPRASVRGKRRRPRFRPALPGRDLRERTSTAEGLRLIPLEPIDRRRYRPRHEKTEPPWRKGAYDDPERGEP
jgi:hypothetical protein